MYIYKLYIAFLSNLYYKTEYYHDIKSAKEAEKKWLNKGGSDCRTCIKLFKDNHFIKVIA